MKKTLWTFGDSFTFGHGCRPDSSLKSYYENYRKENDKIWVDIVGERLNLEIKNFGKCGASNDYILDAVIDNWCFFKKEDYVIIGKTWAHRIEVPLKNDFIHISANWNPTPKMTQFTQDEINTIVNFVKYFSHHNFYEIRQNKRFNFIERLLKEKKIRTIFWDTNFFTKNDNFETIAAATFGEIKDFHFSFKGHSDFAKVILKKLEKSKLM